MALAGVVELDKKKQPLQAAFSGLHR